MPEAASKLLRALFARGARDSEQIGIETDVLVDRQIFIEAEPLRHVADMMLALLGIGHDIDAVDDDAAAIGPHHAGQHAHGRGFAGAIWPDQAEDFAAVNGESQAIRTAVTAPKRLVSPLASITEIVRIHDPPRGSACSVASAGMPGTSSCDGLSMSMRIR